MTLGLVLALLDSASGQAVVTEAPTVEAVTVAENDTSETCDKPDSSRPAPITINTYGGCGGCGGDGGSTPARQTDLSGLEDQVSRLGARVSQLEVIMNQLIAGGGGGGGGGGGTGGGGAGGPFIGQRFRGKSCYILNDMIYSLLLATVWTDDRLVGTVWTCPQSRYYVDIYPHSSYCVDMCPLSRYCVDIYHISVQ